MLAMAAARLGLKTHIYCEESGPAFDVATRTTKAAFDDLAALAAFAARGRRRHLRVRERADRDRAAPGRRSCRCGPAPRRSRWRRTGWPRRSSSPGSASPSRRSAPSTGRTSCALRSRRFAGPAILKTRRLGYDGKGQASVAPGDDAAAAWDADRRRSRRCWRSASPSRCELSALVVRGAGRASSPSTTARATRTRAASCAARSCPSGLPAGRPRPRARHRRQHRRRARLCRRAGGGDVLSRPRRAGGRAADGQRDRAARAQLSGHWTIEACAVSQFENHMRAVAGWPLGSTERHSDAEMVEPDRPGGARLADARRRARRLPAPLRQARGPAGPQDGARDAAVAGKSGG